MHFALRLTLSNIVLYYKLAYVTSNNLVLRKIMFFIGVF